MKKTKLLAALLLCTAVSLSVPSATAIEWTTESMTVSGEGTQILPEGWEFNFTGAADDPDKVGLNVLGNVVNEATVNGNIVSEWGSTFTNNEIGIIGNVTNTITNAGTFENKGTINVESIGNHNLFTNKGSITTIGNIDNAGTLTNEVGASIKGNIANVIANYNEDTIVGNVENYGTVLGEVRNSAEGSIITNYADGIITTVTNGLAADDKTIIANTIFNNYGKITGEGSTSPYGTIQNFGETNNYGSTDLVDNKAGVFNNKAGGQVNVFTQVAEGSVINNEGTVKSVDNSGTFTNKSGGKVTGSVTNYANANFTNEKGGSIVGDNRTITNAGIFTNAGEIDVESIGNHNSFSNTGSIKVVGNIDNEGSLTNEGSIIGNVVNEAVTNPNANAVVDNYGTINGEVRNAAQNSTITNHVGGVITTVTNGLGTDNTTQVADTIFNNEGTITSTIQNFGTTNNTGSAMLVDNQAGTFNNNAGGQITTYAQNMEGATFNNEGEVRTVNNSGIFANTADGVINGTVTNNATGSITTAANKLSVVSQKVNNDGTINLTDGVLNANINTATEGGAGILNTNGTTTIAANKSVTGQTINVAENSSLAFANNSILDSSIVNTATGSSVLLGTNVATQNNAMINIVEGSSLSSVDGVASNIDTAITFGNDSTVSFDVNAAAGKTDVFTNAFQAEGDQLIVSDINLVGLDKVVHNNTNIDLNRAFAINAVYSEDLQGKSFKAMTPIRMMEATIDSNGMMNIHPTSGRNDYKSFNPAILASPIAAQLGGYLTQLNSYDQAFRNMDMYMLMTKKQREAMKLRNKYAAADSNLVFDPTGSAYDDKAVWVRPYATFENVPLKNGPRVSNVAYGSFFGADSELYDLGHGWDGMLSVYAGYNGSHQAYNGIGIYQNGGTLGITGMAYKGNFFTGLTLNAGANVGEANTAYGNDNFTMLMAGIANKTGYNIELADGKFIIQPNVQLSYSFVNTFDYTNAAGVKMNSDPLNAIQVEPGIKFIGNLKNGWQPYAGISMVWNIMDKTNFHANDIALPELSVKPYVRYGVGVRKTWGEVCTGFLQTYFTNGGRNGVGIQGGFRFTLGKGGLASIKTSNSMPELPKTQINLSSAR